MGSEKRMKMLDQHELEQKLERKLKELEEESKHQVSGSGNSNASEEVRRPKIQRVPPYFKGMGFDNYFNPKVISFGLYHHRQHSDTCDGENYKFMWTAMFLQDTNQSHRDLYKEINDHYPQLKDSFRIDDNTSYDPQSLISIWMVDGCSILHVLDKSYEDPKHALKVSIDQLIRVHQDMLLLANQIPFQVLKILCNNDEAKLNKCLQNFLRVHGFMRGGECVIEINNNNGAQDPVHLLDYLHRAMLMRNASGGQINRGQRDLNLRKYRIGSITELKEAGIGVERRPNNTSLFHPRFIDGKLQLPELVVDDSTALILLNLIAYEMCPDFNNDFEITSYVVFLSSLIRQPEDVKILRRAGILINELSSDKEVADVFNKMDTLVMPETAAYEDIKYQIQKYIVSNRRYIKVLGFGMQVKWEGWKSEAYDTFFRSPWTIIGLLAAMLALILTFIQTWFAIHPKH